MSHENEGIAICLDGDKPMISFLSLKSLIMVQSTCNVTGKAVSTWSPKSTTSSPLGMAEDFIDEIMYYVNL